MFLTFKSFFVLNDLCCLKEENYVSVSGHNILSIASEKNLKMYKDGSGMIHLTRIQTIIIAEMVQTQTGCCPGLWSGVWGEGFLFHVRLTFC